MGSRSYILFEKGEFGHQNKNQKERIVRIGTHTKNGRLGSRLLDHFKKENKDRSIFRKNIGRALLNKENDPFLKEWNFKMTTKANKAKLSYLPDPKKIDIVENAVTKYMNEAFEFCILSMPNSESQERCRLEKFLIQTVSNCTICHCSENWLGKYSPVKSIKRSSLWLTLHTNSKPTNDISIDEIKKYINFF